MLHTKYNFHWGPSKSSFQYWQEDDSFLGNGECGKCDMYITPRSLDPHRLDDAMLSVIRLDRCFTGSLSGTSSCSRDGCVTVGSP